MLVIEERNERSSIQSNRIEVAGTDEYEELLQSQQVECPENFFNNFHFRQLEQIFWEPYKHNTRLYASPTAPTVSKETTSTTYCIDRSPITDIDRRADLCRSWHDRKMLNEPLEPNERITFILSSMQSLSIIDSSDTRACSSSHFLQTMMNRSVLLLEIMNGKYLEVQDFLLQQFARKSLFCSKSWHWPIDLKLGVCTSHNILNSLLPQNHIIASGQWDAKMLGAFTFVHGCTGMDKSKCLSRKVRGEVATLWLLALILCDVLWICVKESLGYRWYW